MSPVAAYFNVYNTQQISGLNALYNTTMNTLVLHTVLSEYCWCGVRFIKIYGTQEDCAQTV